MFFIPYKLASKTLTPISFIFIVYLFSILFNALLLLLQTLGKTQGKRLEIQKGILDNTSMKHNLIAGLIFGASSVFGNIAIGKSLEHINAGITVLVFRSDLMLVILLGFIFLKEKLSSRFIIGFILGVSGFIILNLEHTGSIFDLNPLTWALVGALNFAFIQIALKKIVHKIHPVFLNLIRLISGSIITWMLPSFHAMWSHIQEFHIYLAGTAAFFGPFLSRNLQIYALKHIPISEHVLFTMITPVIVLILSWFIWNDIPTPLSLLGALIIFVGISCPFLPVVCLRKEPI